MKNILLAAKNLKIGGIEKSLINLIDYLKENGYTITLVLEEKRGRLIKQLSKDIKIIVYRNIEMRGFTLPKRRNMAINMMHQYHMQRTLNQIHL